MSETLSEVEGRSKEQQHDRIIDGRIIGMRIIGDTGNQERNDTHARFQ